MAELSKNSILYIPDAAPEGIIQIIHGSADHQGRYRDTAQFFADHGYAVLTTDIRGHGNNVNRPNDLGFFGDNAISRITSDIHENTIYIREHFGNIPYALLGQGMGAMIAVIYFKKYDNFLNALILSGLPSFRLLNRAAGIMLFVLAGLRGEFVRSKIVHALAVRPYSSRFSEEGSAYAWLTLDRGNVSKYENDPRCAFIYTLNGYQTLSGMMAQTYGGISWIRKNKNCPVRLLYGSDDPCMSGKKGLEKNIALFTNNGYTDVSSVLYQDCRHELLQDIEKESVMLDVIKCLESSKESSVKKDSETTTSTHIILEDFIDPELQTPPETEEKINLEEFISSHSQGKGKTAGVEIVDFSPVLPADPQEDETILDELLADIGDSGTGDNARFMIDPNNLDGIS